MRRSLAILGLTVGLLGHSATARAAVCDLTTGGSCTDDEGAIYSTFLTQPTGSGVIDPFLRIQATSTESGYNTSSDFNPNTNGHEFQYDQKNPVGSPDVATRDILLSDVPIVELNGELYRQFFLDINEPVNQNKKYLSLDQLQIFLSDDPTSVGVQNGGEYDPTSGQLAGLDAIYSMDPGVMDYVKLNFSLNSGGSGKGDMVLYVPENLFLTAGYTDNTYLFLYSKFGSYASADGNACNSGCKSGDGFEEWWVLKGSGGGGGNPENPVPEPGSLLLVGGGLVLLGRNLKKRRQR